MTEPSRKPQNLPPKAENLKKETFQKFTQMFSSIFGFVLIRLNENKNVCDYQIMAEAYTTDIAVKHVYITSLL